MRGDAVHRRGHAVLAHAVMHIAAGEIARLSPRSCPWPWCCSSGSGRPSRRSAPAPPAPAPRAPRPRPARVASLAFFARQFVARARRSPSPSIGRQLAALRGARTRRACRRRAWRAALSQARRGAAPRAPTRATTADIVGDDERRVVPAEPLARALISSAPSGAPCAAAVPALVGAPKPMIVWQAMSDRPVAAAAPIRAPAAIAAWSWPSIRCGRPAMRLEARELVVASREAGRRRRW